MSPASSAWSQENPFLGTLALGCLDIGEFGLAPNPKPSAKDPVPKGRRKRSKGLEQTLNVGGSLLQGSVTLGIFRGSRV